MSKPKLTEKNVLTDKEWREANKISRKKDEMLQEMIIEIALCLKDKIQTEYFDSVFTLPAVRSSYLEVPMVSWKRRIKANYNAEEDVFVPCEPREICERVVVLFYEAADLITKLQEDSLKEDIEQARRKARVEDPELSYHLLLLVPGFKEYLRKLQAIEDRIYKEKMLSQLEQSQSRRRNEEELPITAKEAQSILVKTEVAEGINIFLAKNMEESIDWLHSFTHTIASSRYDKFERNPKQAMVGSVRLGSDKRSTYLELVKKFNLMTAQKAEKLYEFYPSPAALCERFASHDDLGTVNGKNIVPPSVTVAMRRVFTSTDPSQVITE